METLAMSTRERKRLSVIERVSEGLLRLRTAAEMMKVSYRQAKRIARRYREEGDAGLVHKGRGKASNRCKPSEERQRAENLYASKYAGFGPLLASEHLAGDHGLAVDHETLRRWLIEAGLWKAGKRKQKHCEARERRPRCGDLVQIDGSDHDWFEERGIRPILMVMIDDATNKTYARFYESEDTASAYDVFERYARKYGLPASLYPDRDSIYICTREANIEEELAGLGPETQFARAMRELKVEIIPAYSPQAKGRVERRHGLFQDRLVKEMRLLDINTMDAANKYLDEVFLPMINKRYTVKPKDPVNGHRRCPSTSTLDMALSWHEARAVAKDWTVRWKNKRFQIDARHAALGLPGRRVTIVEKRNGSITILYKQQCLTFRDAPASTSTTVSQSKTPATTKQRKPWIPPPDHPWRKPAVNTRFSHPLRRAIRPILGGWENRRASPGSLATANS